MTSCKKTLLSLLFLASFISCTHWRPFFQGQAKKPVENSFLQITPGKAPEADATYHYLRSQLYYLNVEGMAGLSELEKAARQDPHPYLLFELAHAYSQAGRLDEAQAVVRQLLERKDGGDEIELRYLAAEIEERQDQFELAIASYRHILQLDRTQEKAWLHISRLYGKIHDLPQALDSLKELLEIYPDSERGHFYVAGLYRKLGNLTKARAHYTKALAQNPNLSQAHRQMAQIYEQEENFFKAIEYYQKLLALRPLDEQASSRLIQIFVLRKQPDKAIALLQRLENLVPENIQVKLNLGKIYFEERRYQEALAVFQRILQNKPDYHAVRFYQGVVYEEMEYYNEAMQAFADIPLDAPVYVEAVMHRAYLLQMKNQFAESLEVLKMAVKMKAEAPEIYDLMASAYEHQGQIELATKTLEKTLLSNKNHERLNYHLGALYDRVGRKQDCIVQMKKVIEINPEHAGALNYLGYTYTESNLDLEEAKSLIKRALKIKPNDGFILDSLGWVNYKQGNYMEAIDLLKKAMVLAPDEAIILEHLADVYTSLGRKNHARVLYKKAIALNEKTLADQLRNDDLERLRGKLINLDHPKAADVKSKPTHP